MSFAADVNATTITPNGVTLSRLRGRPVHPSTPRLSEDTVIRNRDGSDFIVESTGVGVTFGDIPIERRWCVDGDGKILEQRDFEDRHYEWYVLHFKARDKAPDDPTNRPVPTVEQFVSETVSPDGVHYWPTGFDPHKPAEGPVVRPNFKLNDPTELHGYVPVKESKAEEAAAAAQAEVAELRAQVKALMDAQAEAPKAKRTRKPMSEEQKQRARENLAKARAAKAAASAPELDGPEAA